jgi:hypothetical protein
VFVGFDQPKSLGEKISGGTIALPIFNDIAKKILGNTISNKSDIILIYLDKNNNFEEIEENDIEKKLYNYNIDKYHFSLDSIIEELDIDTHIEIEIDKMNENLSHYIIRSIVDKWINEQYNIDLKNIILSFGNTIIDLLATMYEVYEPYALWSIIEDKDRNNILNIDSEYLKTAIYNRINTCSKNANALAANYILLENKDLLNVFQKVWKNKMYSNFNYCYLCLF